MDAINELRDFFNGNTPRTLADLRLEGLHYVHVVESERYDFVVDGLEVPRIDANNLTAATLSGRYAKGLFVAPCTRVYNSIRNKILLALDPNCGPNNDGTGGTATADQQTLAARMAQLAVAACIANGTGVRGLTRTGNKTDDPLDDSVRNAVLDMYRTKILRNAAATAADVSADIGQCKEIAIGFEAVNEAYANFFHTNHHNKSSNRFVRGIRFAYVAVQAAFECPAVPVDGLDLRIDPAVKATLENIILRDVIHDTRHDNVAKLVYGNVNDIGYPVTDHNRFSFSNAPAGLSDVSAAVSVLNTAGALLHADYRNAANSLVNLNGAIQMDQGLDRFRYSPFAQYVLNRPAENIPNDGDQALALAGALVLAAEDQNNHDACPFMADTQFQAVAVRKRATPAARAIVDRHIAIKGAASTSRRNVTAAHPDVAARINATIAQEIQDLVL